MSKRRDILMSALFWSALVVASGAAFSAGFYYTHGATANVPVKQPVRTTQHPMPTPRGSVKPSPSATPTLAPGPIPVSLAPASPTPDAFATPTPAAFASIAESSDPGVDPAAEASPAGAPTYRVQVGAFDSRETAQKQVEDLQTQGINAVVVWDGGSYRAQLGAFKDRARALSVADEVNNRGYAVTIRH